jgi:D-lactate dehydrogenase
VHPPGRELLRDLAAALSPAQILSRPLDRLGRSADASVYHLVPEVVVRPRNVTDVQALFACASRHQRHLTFRAAGTSLSGQAVTDGILVELAPFWKAARVLDEGRRVWSQPGVVGGHLNRRLLPFATRLGPDPASIEAAMMGGILANNASGMCCGVAQNSYHTLESLTVVLADGTVLDTGHPDADESLRRARPDVHAGLLELRDSTRADPALTERIRRRFSRKNTTGYSLQALLDHDAPAQILARLMVGSQGTLGFVADMTLRTVPEPPARATALLYFADLAEAAGAVAPLAEAGAAALELLDAACLRSQKDGQQYPFPIEERTAALLVELREADPARLAQAVARAERALSGVPLLVPAAFTTDAAAREEHWRLRRGLFPLVGARRAPGTAVVTEDIAVPVGRLAEAVTDTQALLARHGFPETAIFGHAKDGNLHFVFAQDFSRAEAVARYDAFMRGLVDLVVGKYDGSLKAEHGSGRNMAPFVKAEWGEAGYGLMQRIKALLDPHGLLNPGVVLSDDPQAHLKHLKPLTRISPLADRCIECGFCDSHCPSRDLTLTPRQRIVTVRELARLASEGGSEARALRRSLLADFAYEGIATCAADGMCQTACPVRIDTGALVKEMREAAHARWGRWLAGQAARHFALTAALARGGLRLGSIFRAWPRPAPALPPPAKAPAPGRRVVYLPSCLTRVVGALPGEDTRPPAQALQEVLEAAGYGIHHPEGLRGLCCGLPFASKGFPAAAQDAGRATLAALRRASRDGADPIVTDASPCAAALRELVQRERETLRVLDFPAFWATQVLPELRPARWRRRPGTAVLHPTCSLIKEGGLGNLLAVARAHAERVVVPAATECCGFAGDRGFLVPELTQSATASEAAEVRALLEDDPTAGLFSTCRTCEIGMTRAVGRPYRSLAHLVRETLLDA